MPEGDQMQRPHFTDALGVVLTLLSWMLVAFLFFACVHVLGTGSE
jgi:hypothetical protein